MAPPRPRRAWVQRAKKRLQPEGSWSRISDLEECRVLTPCTIPIWACYPAAAIKFGFKSDLF
jgi:hypothetical protein